MHSRSDSVQRLLSWCSRKRIHIDERLSVIQDETTGEISVFNLTGEAILASQILVRIPRRWMISIRTCVFSDSLITCLADNGIHVPVYGHGAQLTLALALYNELLLGSRSEWADYLQSLPQKAVPIGLLWGYRYSDEDVPERKAIDWKHNHNLERLFINPETGVERLTEILNFYERVVEPFLSSRSVEVNLKGYHHAYSLVTSRAFLVDGYHGLSMVPIADSFNHSGRNQIHLESDFDVCMECGSVKECVHDGQQSALVSDYRSSDSEEEEDEDVVEMVTNAVVHPAHEVFNTYGETISNDELLINYGFQLSA